MYRARGSRPADRADSGAAPDALPHGGAASARAIGHRVSRRRDCPVASAADRPGTVSHCCVFGVRVVSWRLRVYCTPARREQEPAAVPGYGPGDTDPLPVPIAHPDAEPDARPDACAVPDGHQVSFSATAIAAGVSVSVGEPAYLHPADHLRIRLGRARPAVRARPGRALPLPGPDHPLPGLLPGRLQEVRDIPLAAPSAASSADDAQHDLLARSALVIGIIFYIAGTLSFIGIAVAFFALRMYELSTDSRIAFIILFAGLFCTFQGLIFILVARGGEVRRRQNNYLIEQMTALYSHGAPSQERLTRPPD